MVSVGTEADNNSMIKQTCRIVTQAKCFATSLSDNQPLFDILEATLGMTSFATPVDFFPIFDKSTNALKSETLLNQPTSVTCSPVHCALGPDVLIHARNSVRIGHMVGP
jgi:hypothetical protein